MMIVKRSRTGSRLMSLSRSTSTGLRGVRHRQQDLARAFLAARDLVQRRRQRRAFGAGLRRQAVDELLAEQRLRFDRAAGVGAEVLKAGVFDLQHDRRLRLRRGGDRPHGSDLDAVDLHVLAGNEVAGVVEDRADRVAPVRAARRGGEQHDRHQRGHAESSGDSGRASPPPDDLRPQPDHFLAVQLRRRGAIVSMAPPVLIALRSSSRPAADVSSPLIGLLLGARRLVSVPAVAPAEEATFPPSAGSRPSGTSSAPSRRRSSSCPSCTRRRP